MHIKSLENRLRQNPVKAIIMYLRRLFSDKKTKLVYSNGLSQVHLSSLFSDGDNRTAYKKCLIETQKSSG